MAGSDEEWLHAHPDIVPSRRPSSTHAAPTRPELLCSGAEPSTTRCVHFGMRASLILAPRWWMIPVALCTLVTVSCSTVRGSSAGTGAGAPSSLVAPSPLPEQPGGDGDPSVPEPSTPPVPTGSTAPETQSPGESGPSGGDPSTEPIGPTSPPSSKSPQLPVPDPDPSTPPDPGTPPDPSSPTPSTSADGLLGLDDFRSPTLNIGCRIEGGLSVRCDLNESAITEKHDCHGTGAWGQAVSLKRGQRATMLCISDTVMDQAAPVLAYGASTRVGSITCTSRQDGMYCQDDLGHGFRLARSSYDAG